MSPLAENKADKDWSLVVKPTYSLFDLRLGEIWQYRDLVYMFVKRDFVAVYKQTILGPLWFVLQPIIMTLIYSFIFGRVAGLSAEGIPKFLFFFSGVVSWNFFADSLRSTSSVFTANAEIFGKVYFPRIITPVSIVLFGLIKFCIQFVIFLIVLAYFLNTTDGLEPNLPLILIFTPIIVLIMGGLGLGSGIIISSLTTKYKDFTFLVAFGVQLMMFVSPVLYDLKQFGEYEDVIMYANPMSPIIQTFRYIYLGKAGINPLEEPHYMLFSVGVMCVMLVIGVLIFNKVEKTFMDTV